MSYPVTDRRFGAGRREVEDMERILRPDHHHRRPIVTDPCAEDYITGSNILTHPGFETQPTGGPAGDEIPLIVFGTQTTQYSDGSAGPTSDTWVAEDPGASDIEAVVSTVAPRSGTSHLRYQQSSDGGPTENTDQRVFWISQALCDDTKTLGFSALDKFYSARVNSGDLVNWQAYAKASNLTGTPRFELELDVFEIDGTFIQNFFLGFPTLTTSYAQFTLQATMPANSYYLHAYFRHSKDTTGAIHVDVDDAILGIT